MNAHRRVGFQLWFLRLCFGFVFVGHVCYRRRVHGRDGNDVVRRTGIRCVVIDVGEHCPSYTR